MSDGVQQQDPDGVWRDAIPYPFYVGFGRMFCPVCRQYFKNEIPYHAHYRSEHTSTKEEL